MPSGVKDSASRRRSGSPGSGNPERRKEALGELADVAKRHGISKDDARLAGPRQRILEDTVGPNGQGDHVRTILDALDADLLRTRARRVDPVQGPIQIACRVEKVPPAPISVARGCPHDYGAEEFDLAVLDHQGRERCPLCVATGLRLGYVVALVGWRKLGKSPVEGELAAAEEEALRRENLRREFAE